MNNTNCIMHLKSDVDNILYDVILGVKRNKSLQSHSAKLLTYKSKKLCKKKWRKQRNIQSVFLLSIHTLSKKSEQVA